MVGTTPAPKVECFTNNNKTGVKAQNFIGAMAYERLWFDKDKFAFSFGGGWISNPGGYLVLLPPVNGANAISGSPYFTQFGNPGSELRGIRLSVELRLDADAVRYLES